MIDRMTVLDLDSCDGFASDDDCLILIYKDRCPYCEVLFKVIGKCLPLYPDLKTGKINSEEYPAVLDKLGVSKVPTILVYRNGAETGRRSGVMNPAELSALIEKKG